MCGADSKAVRVECRVGGADLNPYLAFAALIAAGLDGIEKKLELEPAFAGDAYDAKKKLREMVDPFLPRAEGALKAIELAQLIKEGRVVPVDTRDAGAYQRIGARRRATLV